MSSSRASFSALSSPAACTLSLKNTAQASASWTRKLWTRVTTRELFFYA